MFDETSAAWATASLTFLLVCVTCVYVWATIQIQRSTRHQATLQAEALTLQNSLFKAQLLSQRFDMYWRTRAPISDEQVNEVAIAPDDVMDPEEYKNWYKDHPDDLRRYLYLARCYEYLAFAHSMKTLGLPDPLGDSWTQLWASDLARHPEFRKINSWYERYYPGVFFSGRLARNQARCLTA